MPFTFTDSHITDFYHHGYTVFRSILPPSLVTDLRAAGEKVREILHRTRGPENARSMPIGRVEGEMDIAAFRDYVQYAPLVDAVQRVLTPQHDIGDLQSAVLFFTYPVSPSCQDWHRDLAETYAGVDPEEWKIVSRDQTFFAQINCALYTDSCLWYVPGSAGRPNTRGELQAAGPPYGGEVGRGRLIDPDLVGKSYAEQERLCLEYCQGMPGGVNVFLEAGDFAMYRPHGWHTGNYAPHRRRLTLHHTAWSPPTRAWYDRWLKRRAEVTARSGAAQAR